MKNDNVQLNVTRVSQAELKELMAKEIAITGCQITQSAIKAIAYLNKPMVNGARMPKSFEPNDAIVVISSDAYFDKNKRIYDVKYQYYLVTIGA
jgi:hypothetical protein